MTTKTTAKKVTAEKVEAVLAVTMTPAAMDKAIDKVITTSKTLQSDIHDVAVAIMLHCYNHNDFSRAQVLVDGLGEGVRRGALVEWFQAAGLKVNADAAQFSGFNRNKMADKWDKVKSTPWYTMKPERPFAGFDLMAELERLLGKADKAAKKDKDTPADQRAADYSFNVDEKLLATLRTMVQPANTTVN